MLLITQLPFVSFVLPQVISDQKLIYSGQLLSDTALLKDVLRKYEGQKAHSLHLVCTPPRGYAETSHRNTTPRVSTPSAPSRPPPEVNNVNIVFTVPWI